MTQVPPKAPPYHCPWCGHASDPAALSCSACGAPVDVRAVHTDSGWYKMPPVKDMARIQFGQSTCQIEGAYVPVADFKLAAGDGVYFAHHLLLWKDDQVKVSAMSMAKGWKRLLAGLPLIMTQAVGPGRIAFSKDSAGELIAIPLNAGQSVHVREHIFMVATLSVAYDWFATDVWFKTASGDDTETHYPIGMSMDKFHAPSVPGLLLLHGSGNVFVRQLQAGQSILIKPTALLFKDATVQMGLHVEHPGGTWTTWRSWGSRYLWLRLRGPGRVAVQSNYEPLEDPGNTLDSVAPATTRHQW